MSSPKGRQFKQPTLSFPGFQKIEGVLSQITPKTHSTRTPVSPLPNAQGSRELGFSSTLESFLATVMFFKIQTLSLKLPKQAKQ